MVLGASAVLLTTPKEGLEIQDAVKDYIEMILDIGRKAAEARKSELETRIQKMDKGAGI